MTEGAILDIRDLTLGYGGNVILADVSFAIQGGEFWFFLGPNGKGKTTLLSALMGILNPKKGEIVRKDGHSDRQHIGYVPQRSEPNPTLPTTVREFVSLGFVGTRVARGDRKEHLRTALAKVGLTGTERKTYWSLSGGERQRALVARALVRDPKLLLVDEPTNHLDPVAEHLLLDTLGLLNRTEKITIVFVTHDLSIASEYATHLAFFGGGRVETGTVAEILTPERLERTYGVPFSVHRNGGGSPVIRIKESEKPS